MPLIDFNLYLITDRKQLPPGRDLVDTVAAALAGGVRAVQLREKDLAAAELFPLARELRELTARYGARLLINDRLDVALAVGADGVHLGGHSLPVAATRKILGPDKLIGVSTHRPEEVATARQEGADFVTFGPVFFTSSKAAYGDPVGLDRLREACTTSLPVFALGGVTCERLAVLRAAGARGVGLISAILAAPDPATAAAALLTGLRDTPPPL
ncbi:MAG TPA: thiamine phosphate synthase [Desulfuromonadales bacterium]|jgi:thiamine-phosphate pyrophosphorylase